MPDMKEFNDSKKLEEIVSAINEQGAISAEEVREIIAALLEQNKISVEQSDSAQETTNSLKELINSSSEMVETTKEQNDSLNSLSAAAEAQSMAASNGSDSSKPIVDAVHSLGSYLKSMVTLARKADKAETKNSRFFKKLGSVLTKKKDKETTVAKSNDKKEDKGGGLSLDVGALAKGIGGAISGVISKILSPIALVKAFFTELLPILLIAGILLYAFISNWFDVDLLDVIIGLVGVIIVAYLAYRAWLMAKELIVFGIKIACEFLKVAIQAAASWAANAAVIAMVMLVGIAFLAAIALFLIIFAACFLVIGLVFVYMVKEIIGAIISLISVVKDIFLEFVDKLIDVFLRVVEVIASVFSGIFELFFDLVGKIFDILVAPINAICSVFSAIGEAIGSIVSGIVKIFSGIAGKLIRAIFGGSDDEESSSEDKENFVVNSMEASLWCGWNFAGELFDAFTSSFDDTMSAIRSSLSFFFAPDELLKPVTDSIDDVLSSIDNVVNSMFAVIVDAVMGITAVCTNAIAAIWTMAGVFITLLYSIPLMGFLMGITGANSFSEAIQPLVAQTEIIVSLLSEIVANNAMMKSQQAVPYSMTNVTEGDNYGDNSSLTTIGQTDGTSVIESPTNFISSSKSETSDGDTITNSSFEKYMKDVIGVLKEMQKASNKTPNMFLDVFRGR